MNFLKGVLDNIETAVVVTDKRLRVRFVNRPVLDLFSITKKGKTLRDLIICGENGRKCGTGAKCVQCQLRNLFSDAQKSNAATIRKMILRSKDGSHLSCTVKVTPMGKLLVAYVYNAFEAEIARELSTAQTIQQKLLPPAKSPSRTPYSYMYIPFREIGGDLPDVYETAGETMGFLADVSGKGISAGMLSAFVKAGWDKALVSPSVALRGLSSKFQDLNLDETAYVTAAAVRIDKERSQIRYSFAGHNAPLLLKSGPGIDEIEMSSPPVSNWIPNFGYEDQYITYRKGDILVMLTDGVIESRNKKGEMFSLERVEEVLRKSETAEIFIEKLRAALTDFCGKFDDDVTAIAFDLQ